MRVFKNNKILLIILLAISLCLSSCRSKNTLVEEPAIVAATEEEPALVLEEQPLEEVTDVAQTEIDKAVENPGTVDLVVEPEKPEKDTDKAEPTKNPPAEEAEIENALKIQGNVEIQVSLTLDELKGMNDIIFEDDFYSLNNFGTTSYTHFKGVNLWNLLEQKSGISSNATKITVIAVDGYKVEFTIDQVKKQDYIDETNLDKRFPMIIAWEEKNQEYDSSEGPPYKLVVGQREAGDVNKPQWISNIDRIIVE